MKRPIQHTPARAPEAIQFARYQWATANECAQTVWQSIRNRQIYGQKIRREFPVPPYTTDFCCVELKLVLEVDGADHVAAEGQQRDRARDQTFARLGFLVTRIPGYDILREPERVLAQIKAVVSERIREFGR